MGAGEGWGLGVLCTSGYSILYLVANTFIIYVWYSSSSFLLNYRGCNEELVKIVWTKGSDDSGQRVRTLSRDFRELEKSCWEMEGEQRVSGGLLLE